MNESKSPYNPTFDFVSGEVLLINKPYRWTSFDVVKKIRNAIKIKKVGHAGTLDPLATGLLIICTGKKTKTINQIQEQVKVYEGEMVIGKITPSYDLETEITEVASIEDIDISQLHKVCKSFLGKITQVPPLFSAVKVNGKRAYEHARNNETVKLKSREVHIYDFELTSVNLPEISFSVKCSKGTYIRSLVNDFGKLIGKGAYLSALKRISIGDYHIKDAYQLEKFISCLK